LAYTASFHRNNVSGSVDPDGDTLTLRQSPVARGSLGATSVTLAAGPAARGSSRSSNSMSRTSHAYSAGHSSCAGNAWLGSPNPDTAIFLASRAGDFVVGSVITVDGGIAFATSPARSCGARRPRQMPPLLKWVARPGDLVNGTL